MSVFDVVREEEEGVGQTRRMWVACFGVPLHGWTLLNFRKTGEVWGRYRHSDSDTVDGDSFEVVKILIDTSYVHFVDGWVSLILEGKKFYIRVKEIGGEGVHCLKGSQWPLTCI